ncbi:MAG: pyridoxal phosphate-dependent aminotransferase [Nostocoides sp.]
MTAFPGSIRGRTEPFYVMELLKAANDRARRGQQVLTMCAGQPSTPAPALVREAAAAALASGAPLGYTDALGLLELREAIAGHYEATYAVVVNPERIAVTTGSSAAFTALFLAAFDPGDTVLMTRPGYPAYRNTLQALSVQTVELPCGPQVRFQPTLAMLHEWAAEHGRPPKGLIIASPANPTGTVIDPAELAAITSWCTERGVLLISDEIYHGITFGDVATASALETTEQVAVVGSLSKYFSMTGWRVGWVILPEPLVRPVELLLGNLNICAPHISQVAGIAAFDPASRAELDGHVRRYADNRDVVLSRLPDLGVTSWAPADGAFYAYADISSLTDDSYRWCFEVLDATGVAVTPGADFAPARRTGPGSAAASAGVADPLDGSRWFRLSFAGTTAEADEAMNRLAAYVA